MDRLTLEQLTEMKSISVGEKRDLKFEDQKNRVWLDQEGVVVVERQVNCGVWAMIDKYKAL